MTDASVGVEVPEFDPVCLLECGELAGEGTNGREVPVRGGRGVESSSPKLKRNRKWVQKMEGKSRAREGCACRRSGSQTSCPFPRHCCCCSCCCCHRWRKHQRAEASAGGSISSRSQRRRSMHVVIHSEIQLTLCPRSIKRHWHFRFHWHPNPSCDLSPRSSAEFPDVALDLIVIQPPTQTRTFNGRLPASYTPPA